MLKLSSESREFNYYYLCADLHQYQVGTVGLTNKTDDKIFNIKQFIVGTGGASIDPYDPDEIGAYIALGNTGYETEDFHANYDMTPDNLRESTAQNGFLICSQMGRDLNFQFLPTPPSGGKRKTKKNRKNRKTKKLKNNKTKHSKRKTKKNLYHH